MKYFEFHFFKIKGSIFLWQNIWYFYQSHHARYSWNDSITITFLMPCLFTYTSSINLLYLSNKTGYIKMYSIWVTFLFIIYQKITSKFRNFSCSILLCTFHCPYFRNHLYFFLNIFFKMTIMTSSHINELLFENKWSLHQFDVFLLNLFS